MPQKTVCLALLWLSTVLSLPGAVVGTNPPAQSLTLERIAGLPPDQQGPWRDYLVRSAAQRRADKDFVAAELKAAGLKSPIIPAERFSRSMPLDRPDEWYGSPEALRTADSIVSYQMPNGGWGKNLSMRDHVRKPGESFIGNNISRYLGPDDFDRPADFYWNYFGTLDNDATTTQIRFLAKVVTAVGPVRGAAYRDSFLRGIGYLFASQYPNGGWPQVWPIEGGYHDTITFNDDAVTQALEVLEGCAERKGMYAFVPAELSRKSAERVAIGLKCVLACQIVVRGRLTAWCQQHDALTLAPASARNFEPPEICGEESSNVVSLLMTLPDPSPEVVKSVHAAAAWFQKTAIVGMYWNRPRFRRPPNPEGGSPPPPPAQAQAPQSDAAAPAPHYGLQPKPGAGPIWARYYQIGTDRPVFGDRDKTIHDRVEELSIERQRGYNWFGDTPKAMLEAYAEWSREHPFPSD